MKKSAYPVKRQMNLYYRPDRTTRPATIALYVLFAVVVLAGLSKVLVYDLWAEVQESERALSAVETRLDGVMAELSDYGEVQERYRRYSATEEEQALIDRMEVLSMLEDAIGNMAEMNNISINGSLVQVQFSGVTLAQSAQIVNALESSPIVAGTTVNTASTTEESGALVQAGVLIQLQKGDAE